MIEIIVIGVVIVAVLAAFLLIARWGMKGKDELVAAMTLLSATRDQLASVAAEVERDEFELKTIKAALAAEERLTVALTKELADAIERSSIGAGLPPGDVLGRLQRIAQARQAGAGDPVPAKPDEGVHHAPTSERPGDALLPFDEDADVQPRPAG